VKPSQFAYHAPADVAGVVALLADPDADARVIAGGQSLVPMMNFRIAAPATLVDLRNVAELDRLVVDDGTLVVGAGVTQAELLEFAPARAHWPLLAEALAFVGHPQTRNRGTVCGSLAHHDPTGELPACAVALDAVLVAVGPEGRREIPAADFFVSYYETGLRTGELLTEVRFPARPPGEGHAFVEVARKHGDFALVGAAAVLGARGGVIIDPGLVLIGVSHRALRLGGVEAELAGSTYDEQGTRGLLATVAAALEPSGDNRASAEYRRDVAVALLQEAVDRAWKRAEGER
jgi:aerobic carbon-monoxide dehydrogenase medium subunit